MITPKALQNISFKKIFINFSQLFKALVLQSKNFGYITGPKSIFGEITRQNTWTAVSHILHNGNHGESAADNNMKGIAVSLLSEEEGDLTTDKKLELWYFMHLFLSKKSEDQTLYTLSIALLIWLSKYTKLNKKICLDKYT